MKAGVRMAAILFFVALFKIGLACEVDDVAVYEVRYFTNWTEHNFPKDYPSNRPKAQWSQTIIQAHNSSYVLYRVGEVARSSVRSFSQSGKISDLMAEGEVDPRVYYQLGKGAIGGGEGGFNDILVVDGAHSLVSLMSHLVPSPDWFVGVDSVDLCVQSTWGEQLTLDLTPLDAGAASGLTFTAPRWDTAPPVPVSRLGPRSPDHPAAGFYYPDLKELPSIAKIQFIKMKEYTSKDLNRRLRKTMTGFLNAVATNKTRAKQELEKNNEVSKKSPLDELKDLEEDPVGTPPPNVPDNNVAVVTRAPSAAPEFVVGLRTMDDVALAVARGRQLGQGRRLPRHFRAWLHHAVNRKQKNDCEVSAWGEWSACSVTCGFGEQYRQRSVLREKRADGRDCPPLRERRHCGDVNSCFKIDYFEW